jgi:TolB-like protein
MAAEVKKEIALEIAHVLFIDIVAYSRMATDDQRAAIDELNQIVQSTDEYRQAQSENRLLKLATGDGMALIFYHSPEDPVECALEISRAIKEQHSNLRVRMGVNSGPVSGVVDVNGRANVAGAGINTAQRVMDCGDAGHILLSKRVAEDLEQFKHWRPHLYHIGECEVKHGDKIEIVNLFTAELGNAERPKRMAMPAQKTDVGPITKERAPLRKPVLIIAACLAVAALAVAAFLFWQRHESKTSAAGLDIPEKSIAVLPFENLSDEKQNAFFADGVQDEILTDLAKIADLKVISRSSVMHYKSGVERNLRKIGEELGVARLLEGSVQRSGNRVRVNAQLIDARNDAHLWAQTYDRDLSDVFAIQSEIARAIADQLQAKLSPSEQSAIAQPPTRDVDAFDLYNLRQAVGLLQQAITRDPKFAAAYVSLADAHDQLYAVQGDHTAERLALAEAALARLREIEPEAGMTHLAIARHRYFAFRDYAGARAELTSAARTLPNEPAILALSAFIDRRAGKWDESVRELSEAIERDPRNTFFMQQASLTYGLLRRYGEMAAVLDRALAIDPDSVETRVARALVDFHWRANTQPLHDEIKTAVARDPASGSTAAENWINLACCERDPDALSRALAAVGNRRFSFLASVVNFDARFGQALLNYLRKDPAGFKEALRRARTEQEQFIRQQPGYVPQICALALIDAMLGNKEEALSGGRRATELVPITHDAIMGTELTMFFAGICAWAGDKNLALEQLAKATSGPSFVSYGHLKLHPLWDPLRGDPRFEKIVASLAPK